jgi:hypothetical protein
MKKTLQFKDFLLEKYGTFDFKQIFLDLTKYTIPFGQESILEPILYGIVPDLKKDGFGNYHITIGSSKTLFTSHLDTYSKKKELVNHIIEGSIIKTDGKTILGGDNKNGVIVLLYMITQKVPGIYYFFVGEEGITTGDSCNGSNWLLKNNPKIYTTVDRAIAFDRRGKGSVVTKQRGRLCCSDEFADSIVEKFGEIGMEFKKDYAYGTDSAVFMDIVPEITNISSGGEYEHSFLESTDIDYLKKVSEAVTKIDWESLPVVREPKAIETIRSKFTYEPYTKLKSKRTFKKLQTLLGVKGFLCLNSDKFQPNAIMQFEQFVEDKFINARIFWDRIKIVDDNYFNGEFTGGTITELEQHFNIDVETMVKKVIGAIVNKMNDNYEISKTKLYKILDTYSLTYYQFKNFIINSEDYKGLFKFYPSKVYMDIIANQSSTIKRQREQEEKTKSNL